MGPCRLRNQSHIGGKKEKLCLFLGVTSENPAQSLGVRRGKEWQFVGEGRKRRPLGLEWPDRGLHCHSGLKRNLLKLKEDRMLTGNLAFLIRPQKIFSLKFFPSGFQVSECGSHVKATGAQAPPAAAEPSVFRVGTSPQPQGTPRTGPSRPVGCRQRHSPLLCRETDRCILVREDPRVSPFLKTRSKRP